MILCDECGAIISHPGYNDPRKPVNCIDCLRDKSTRSMELLKSWHPEIKVEMRFFPDGQWQIVDGRPVAGKREEAGPATFYLLDYPGRSQMGLCQAHKFIAKHNVEELACELEKMMRSMLDHGSY